MKKRVAIFISGGGSNMVSLLDSMATPAHPARPVLVLSNVPGAAGLAKASERGVPTAVVNHRDFPGDRSAFEHAMEDVLERVHPDIICLAGFMRILTPEFVTRWSGQMLNIHPSLLPRHKGLDTHARAIAAGDLEHGCTVHEVTPVLDDGTILGQARLFLDPGETETALAARVLKLEHRLYPEVLSNFAEGKRTLVSIE